MNPPAQNYTCGEYNILNIINDKVRREIESIEDQKVYNVLISFFNIANLGKALEYIPNTRWKKFKYHVKNTFGLIK